VFLDGMVSMKVKQAVQSKRSSSNAETDMNKLAAALGDRDPVVRHRARLALVALGPASVPHLIAALESPRGNARWEAAKSLQAIADARAGPALVARLADRDPDVCWVVAEALIALGPKAIPPLMQGLIAHNDSNTFLESAHHVLHDLNKGVLRNLVGPVLQALNSPSPDTGAPLAARAALRILAAASAKAGAVVPRSR
jgi:HEAT repeat protein